MFGFKTPHPRNGNKDPSRRRLQNQTPIGLNSTVQNIDETPTSSSLDKHRMLTLRLEHQQKCISQPLKPVPVAQPQSKQVQWMPFPTEHMAITATRDRKTSTTTPAKQYDAPARVSSRSNKGIAPRRYGFEE